MTRWFDRFLARQFASPSGLIGRWVIAPALNRIGGRLNDLAWALLEPRAGEGVLEIGYGGGRMLKRLSAVGLARLVGVDRSGSVPHAIPGADLRQAEAGALPFGDASFDAVLSVSVLHFWRDLLAPLREIARVLRPGGRLVLVFEPPEALKLWPGHRHGFELWTPEQVVEAAGVAGLALEHRKDGQGRRPAFFVGLRFRKALP